MSREEAEQILKKHKWQPPAGCTYLPTFISEWMIDAMIEAYVIGMQDGKEYMRDGECL